MALSISNGERRRRLGIVLVEQGSLTRETAKRGGNSVEFDLLDLEVVRILMDHIVRSEEAKRKVLC